MDPVAILPVLTPHGHLVLNVGSGGGPHPDSALARRLLKAFERGSGHGLLQLGAEEAGTVLPPMFAYWRDFGARYVTALCMLPEAAGSVSLDPIAAGKGPAADIPAPSNADLADLAAAAPPMIGAEYLTVDLLRSLWSQLRDALAVELAESREPVQDFLKSRNPGWNLVGRVHFNLAENRRDEAAPFAFLATYTTRLSTQARAQHLPLGQALREYAGAAKRDRLLSLLLPVQRAAQSCGWLKTMVDEGELFHPLRWGPPEALRLLQDVPLLEAAGIVVRMPAAWRGGRPARPQVRARIGSKPMSGLGQDSLLDFDMSVTLGSEPLTPAEIEALLAGTEGLALVRGQWVEVDRERLVVVLERFQRIDREAAENGITFAEAMRLLAGADIADNGAGNEADTEWSQVVTGTWLAQTLSSLRGPEGLEHVDPGAALKGKLRPYQQVGVRWLHLLSRLGLGACLADDMGLGKTIQVLSLLLVKKRGDTDRNGARDAGTRDAASGQSPDCHRPSLLVAPASLLANWAGEIARFAPTLRTLVAHSSAMPASDLKVLDRAALSDCDLVLTSYGSLLSLSWIHEVAWDLVVLDEAQAIKNPDAKQTRAAKRLHARARFALTGTPVENKLADLWSIFDFLNPGLLGSAKEFTRLVKRLEGRKHNPYGPLRSLIRPYILRRLKTDKAVIADLPDKLEVKAYCQLSRKQAALYQRSVKELAAHLVTVDGIRRRGLILSYITRFKQICNHPSHWLGDGHWSENDSGKWERLRELSEVIASKQEKLLVFTQFREITAPLASFLAKVFGRPGVVLHGDVAVGKRKDLVRRFQEDESVPFFVLSLKAGGSGLNLTAASHVVHFDRWWNPAVENQATDRAFRIGQEKNVLVHKFLCRGTVEEKIDQMIDAKQGLSKDLLEQGASLLLTEMKDEELIDLVSLDIRAALKEA